MLMRVDEARALLENVPKVARGLDALHEAGLGYITLGQSSTTLSGGEAQRVKLASELGRVATGRTLYILDEPTTGLHFADVDNLLRILLRLADLGNTVVVIEHNPDVLRAADWLIDLGPDAGDAGGSLVAMGPPDEVAGAGIGHTSRYL
jgi:excinuclease ABC subunit A